MFIDYLRFEVVAFQAAFLTFQIVREVRAERFLPVLDSVDRAEDAFSE